MTTSSVRKHAGPGPTSDQAPVPEPKFAKSARTLDYLGRLVASLPCRGSSRDSRSDP